MVRRSILLACVMAATACSGAAERADQTTPAVEASSPAVTDASSAVAPADPATPAPSTEPTLDQIDKVVGDDGVDLDEALTLFAAMFGPIPGYEDVPAMVPADDEVVFGGEVLGWVEDHSDELTDEQRSAVLEVLDPPLPVGGPGEALPASAEQVDAERFRAEARRLQAIADEVVEEQSQLWGIPLNLPVVVRVVPFRTIHSVADTQRLQPGTRPNVDDNGDEVEGTVCYIRMGPAALGTSDERQLMILHHEIFHCFQLDRLGVAETENVAPEWYHEGAAAFVGVALGGDPGAARYWWNRYIIGVGGTWNLHLADYDAFGFWSELQAEGVDVLAVLRTVFQRRIFTEGELLVLVEDQIADPSRTVGLMATRAANQRNWGDRWVPATPGLGSLTATRLNAVVGAEGTTSLVTQAGNSAWELVAIPDGHVRTLEVDGYGAFRWGEETALEGAWSGRWCNAQPCECPDGTPVPGGPWAVPPSSDPAVLQMGALGRTASTGTVTTTSIEDLCRPPASDVWIVIDGEHGGRFSSDTTPPGWCTAEHSGGSLMVSLGDYSAAGSTMATVAVPFADGTVLGDGNVGWTVGGKSYWAIVTVQLSGTGGSFSGRGLDPYVDPRVSDGEFAVSGSFDCGHGGQPPTGAPWPGH